MIKLPMMLKVAIKTINERVENINNINNILIERNNKHHIDNDKSELPLIEDVDLFLKINFRSAPKLTDAMAPSFIKSFSASLCHPIPSLPVW